MMMFDTIEAARSFFNTMHIEYEGLVVEQFYYMRTFNAEIAEIGKPVKVTVGTGGDFFIMAEGVFLDECTIGDNCLPLPERVQKLLQNLVFKGYTPFGLLEAIHEHRIDDAELDIENCFRQTIKQHELMLTLLQ